MGTSFRHFDRNFDGKISFKEFRIVCEELDLRLTADELKALFAYIDDDGGGSIGYTEFLNLSDEKRRGIDPFDNQRRAADGEGFDGTEEFQIHGRGKRQDPDKLQRSSSIM